MTAVVNQMYVQSVTDPTYEASIETKAGKAQQVYRALEQLGILNTIRQQRQDNTTHLPSTPDRSAGKQSVKPLREHIFTRDEIAQMSLDEFGKHESLIDEQLRQGLIQ